MKAAEAKPPAIEPQGGLHSFFARCPPPTPVELGLLGAASPRDLEEAGLHEQGMECISLLPIDAS